MRSDLRVEDARNDPPAVAALSHRDATPNNGNQHELLSLRWLAFVGRQRLY